MLISIIGLEIFHNFFYLKNEIPPIKPIRQFHSAKIINSISVEKSSLSPYYFVSENHNFLQNYIVYPDCP